MGYIIASAVAECINVDDQNFGRFSSSGLAWFICCCPCTAYVGRKAYSLRLRLLLKFICDEQAVLLAVETSGEGLLYENFWPTKANKLQF